MALTSSLLGKVKGGPFLLESVSKILRNAFMKLVTIKKITNVKIHKNIYKITYPSLKIKLSR